MPRIPGRPLQHSSEITDLALLDQAIIALINGPDENTDTTSHGWSHVQNTKGSSEDLPVQWKQWHEELQDIDEVISESLDQNPTVLPATGLLDQIETTLVKLDEWFSAGMPVWHKRHTRYIIDEMGEIAAGLRNGQLDSVAAQERFSNAMGDLSEVVDFSRFYD